MSKRQEASHPQNEFVRAILLMLPLLSGCPPPPAEVFNPIPMRQAIAIVNANAERGTTGLQARGSARGYFVDDEGVKRHFDCGANLLVIAPHHMRLDLQSVGQTQVLFGSNDEVFWVYVKPEIDTYWWGRYAELSAAEFEGIPIRPDMIIESLGINGLPEETTGPQGPFQRIAEEHQQLLFVTYDDEGQGLLFKEYWLSRRAPRLIEQIVFRDAIGRVVMRSRLRDYRPLGGSGPLIAHRFDVDWPVDGGELRLNVRRWEAKLQLTPDHRAFIAPHERGKTFGRMIDIAR